MDENKDVNEYEKEFSVNTITITDDKDNYYVDASLLSENCKYDLETAELRYILDENCKNLDEGFNKSTIKCKFHCCDDNDLTYKASLICKKFYTKGECSYDFNYSRIKAKKEKKEYAEEKLNYLRCKFKSKSVVDSIIQYAKEVGRCENEEDFLTAKIQESFRNNFLNTKESLREYKKLLSDNDFKIISASEVDGYTVEIYGRIKDK